MKMNSDLKSLLSIEGASENTIGLIESYYGNQMEGVKEVFQEEKTSANQQPQQEKPKTKMEMARNARIIK